jgi:hypothetical protein
MQANPHARSRSSDRRAARSTSVGRLAPASGCYGAEQVKLAAALTSPDPSYRGYCGASHTGIVLAVVPTVKL